MTTNPTQIKRGYRKFGGIALTLALVALVVGLASLPARADDDDRGRNDQHERAHRDRHPPPHRYSGYEAPRYIYAPPPVYYAPPPRPPAIDFIFPLQFR